LAVLAAVCIYIGWSMRGPGKKATPAKPPVANDKPQGERSKNLEASLEKTKAALKSTKAELEALQSASVAKSTFDSAKSELVAARNSLESEAKRISVLEADLKKAQDTLKTLNTRLNEGEKAQKDRNFSLENELSKTREQLAILQNRSDETSPLESEIERLRESLAVSTRYAGEMRKREAAAIEALEKAETKIANLSDPSRPATPTPARGIGPVGDSDRIAAAKAEVIRLVEMNKQREIPAPEPTFETPEHVQETPAPVETIPEVEAIAESAVESTPEATTVAETTTEESQAEEAPGNAPVTA
jgi:DNA repair exonuclease SbcCD ATPase subunit